MSDWSCRKDVGTIQFVSFPRYIFLVLPTLTSQKRATCIIFFDYVQLVVSQKPLARCRQDNITKLNLNFNAKMAIVCRLFLLPFVGLFFAKINHVSAKNAQKFVKMIAKPASKTANIHQKRTRKISSFWYFIRNCFT